jgi:hypothetical protein
VAAIGKDLTVGRMVIAAKTGLAAQAAPLPRAGQQ